MSAESLPPDQINPHEESSFRAVAPVEGPPVHCISVMDIGRTSMKLYDQPEASEVPRLGLQDPEPTREHKFKLAETWLSIRGAQSSAETGPVPADIASEVSLVAQQQMNILGDDDVIDEGFTALEAIRNEAVEVAGELDFNLVRLSAGDWSLHARLNVMHHKFSKVSGEAVSSFLGDDYTTYEYRALQIRNIVADHTPALLTEDLKATVDPSQSLWRASSAHASILLRQRAGTNVADMHVGQIPTSLPVSNREKYVSEDDEAMKPLSQMSDDELFLYCRPESVATIRGRGYALYSELTLPTRETILSQRLFEVVGKSNNRDLRKMASERNRTLEEVPILQEGDLIHATNSPEIFEAIVSNGLRCGEAVMGNSRSIVKYPFTVSFLEVTNEMASHNSVADRFGQLRNGAYGGINIVLHRDDSSPDYVKGQKAGVPNQRQIFGGEPSTNIKSIIIRDKEVTQLTIEKVVQTIVKSGMFIPVYSGTTGEQLLTSKQFNSLSAVCE